MSDRESPATIERGGASSKRTDTALLECAKAAGPDESIMDRASNNAVERSPFVRRRVSTCEHHAEREARPWVQGT
jgi:hypothetical protein